jgi:P27 family predicted phage terminase small subunit
MPRRRLSDAEHKLRETLPSPATVPAQSQIIQSKPKMPQYLNADARREWRKLMPMLMERGSLTVADACALSLHCSTVARWIACTKQIEAEGLTQTVTVLDSNGTPTTRTRPHVALKIAQDCEKSLRQSLTMLGLTPASREKVKPTKKEPDREDVFSGLDAIRESLDNFRPE